jgi:antitoxin component of RelBE/YafQ-DinJ toxin-antitoxin module
MIIARKVASTSPIPIDTTSPSEKMQRILQQEEYENNAKSIFYKTGIK